MLTPVDLSSLYACLQVVNSAGETRLVEFYRLQDPALRLPPPLGEVTGNRVLAGSVSDDTCREQPCSNGGNCSVTWNDFRSDADDGRPEAAS